MMKLPLESRFWIWIALGFLLFLAAPVWFEQSLEAPANKEDLPIESQKQSRTDKEDTKGIQANTGRTINNTDSDKNKGQTDNDYSGTFSKWMCKDLKITDLALVYFTYCLVIVGWFTMKGGERATRQLESAIIHSVIDENNLQELLKFSLLYNNSPSMDDGTVNVNTRVKYRYKNYGRTPGIIKEVCHTLIVSQTLPAKPVYAATDTIFRSKMISPGNDTDPFECKLIDYPKMRETNAVVRGQSSIWFYGRIVYDDIFGIEHEHRFCWHYHGGSHGFRPYYKDTEYNKNT